jgi:RND family efflux transporter MFP subunit
MEWDDFTGRFEAADEVEVRARVSGYLMHIAFQDGALVNSGDLLFTIDPAPFQAEFESAEAEVDVAKTQVEFAQQELARNKKLTESGTISASVLDDKRQLFLSAQGELEGAKARQRVAKLNLDYTEIYAPISGRISRKLLSTGNLVQANTTVLTNIVALDPIHFYFDVDERSYLAYARQAQDGERASGRITSYEVKIQLTDEHKAERVGNLDFVDNRIDRDTGTMRARAVVKNTDLFLQPGLFGRISIPGSPLYQGVLVPDEAIGSDQNRRIVFLVDAKGNLAPRPIRPGPRIDGYRVVRDGLDGDETLVIKGLAKVRPGMRITPELVELPPTVTLE